MANDCDLSQNGCVLLEHNSFSCFCFAWANFKSYELLFSTLGFKDLAQKKKVSLRFLDQLRPSNCERQAIVCRLPSCLLRNRVEEVKESTYFAEQCLKSRHISSNRFFLDSILAAASKVTSYRYHKTNCVIYSIFICGVRAEFENKQKME